MLGRLSVTLLLLFGTLNALPDTKYVRVNPNSVPLTPLKVNDGNSKIGSKYSEKPILGEKKIFIEESFYLIVTKTNLSQAYDYIANMRSQVSTLSSFLNNMTSASSKLKIAKNNTLPTLKNNLVSTLNLRIDVSEENLRDMCIPTKHVTDHIRTKRGIFNPWGKVLNYLWGQGDPDEVEAMTEWFETHKDEDKRIIQTQGMLLHLFQITNDTLQAENDFITEVNRELLETKSDVMGIEIAFLATMRFQLICEALETFVSRAKFQIANGKNKFLTRSAIPENVLQAILRNITLQTNFKPPFKNINNYYNAPLSHVHEKNCLIKQILTIPLINPQDAHSIEKTQPRFPGQILYLIRDKHRNYRFLTEADYERCLKSEENSLICNKRKIKIYDTQFGCTGNCPFSSELFVHDLESAHIISLLPNSTRAKIDCNGDIYEYELPQCATFYLPEHCYMETSYFLIERITKIPVHVIPHRDVMLPTALTYERAIETLQMHDYIAKNVSQKFEQRMSNLTDEFNDNWAKANKSNEKSQQEIAEMDAKYELLHFWHTYITTPLLIICFVILLIFVLVYTKLFKSVKDKTTLLLRGLVSSSDTEHGQGFEEIAMKQLDERYESVAKCVSELKEIKAELVKTKQEVLESLRKGLKLVGTHQLNVQHTINSNCVDIYQIKERLGLPIPSTCPSAPPLPEEIRETTRENTPLRRPNSIHSTPYNPNY